MEDESSQGGPTLKGAMDLGQRTRSENSEASSSSSGSSHSRAQGPPPTAPPRTCFQCRRSKVRCDRRFPCGRCVRLDIDCTEQVPCKIRGRPLKLHQTRGGAAQQQQPQAMVRGLRLGATDAAALDHLSGSPLPNPFRFAEIITKTFANLLAEGMAQRVKSTAVLRVWERYYVGHQADYSCGVLPSVGKLLLGDYQLGHSTLTDPSPRSFSVSSAPMANVNATFQTPAGLTELMEDGVSAHSGALSVNGECRIVCNGHFERTFLTAEECNHQLREQHVLPSYVWGRVLHPDDYDAFYCKVSKMIFSAQDHIGEISQMTRAVDKHGFLHPAVVRMRYLYLSGGKDVMILFSVLPLDEGGFSGGAGGEPIAPGSLEDDEQKHRLARMDGTGEPLPEAHSLAQHITTQQQRPLHGKAPARQQQPPHAFTFSHATSLLAQHHQHQHRDQHHHHHHQQPPPSSLGASHSTPIPNPTTTSTAAFLQQPQGGGSTQWFEEDDGMMMGSAGCSPGTDALADFTSMLDQGRFAPSPPTSTATEAAAAAAAVGGAGGGDGGGYGDHYSANPSSGSGGHHYQASDDSASSSLTQQQHHHHHHQSKYHHRGASDWQ